MRVECLVDLDSTACPRCSDALHRISQEIFERSDLMTAQFRVLVILRPHYAYRICAGAIVQALAPARLIECGPTLSSRKSSSPRTPTTYRFSGRHRSSPARASTWAAHY
ncbi:IS66 family transposase zinc-finger binding domain-containing protein [Methylobacterium mesophilicum]|uniref:IS66 family transposase zinc-finger binding domain-containing protein n=1 Tax=Methylobacterium mesophilicum TaxID=39956 RepID=UPI00361B7C4A